LSADVNDYLLYLGWAKYRSETLDITLERLHECCLRLSGYWYGWPWRVWVAETPGMWDTLHTAFDRSSGTLGTDGGGWWGRFVAW